MKYLLTVLLFLSMVGSASAQTGADIREGIREAQKNILDGVEESLRDASRARKDLREDTREEIKDVREDIEEQIGDVTAAAREGVRAKREVMRNEIIDLRNLGMKNDDLQMKIEERRDAFETEIRTRREALKLSVEEKREELKNRIEEQRNLLKEKLQLIKDERKQQIVERVHDGLNALNERLTDKFLESLEQLDKVVLNISSRADKAEARGEDVAPVRTAIDAAENSIAEARLAVQAQAGVGYSIDVTDEETLRETVREARDRFRNDIGEVREKLKSAREKVHDAANILALVNNVDDDDDSDDDSFTSSTTSTISN